jgi:hypothetical protein
VVERRVTFSCIPLWEACVRIEKWDRLIAEGKKLIRKFIIGLLKINECKAGCKHFQGTFYGAVRRRHRPRRSEFVNGISDVILSVPETLGSRSQLDGIPARFW